MGKLSESVPLSAEEEKLIAEKVFKSQIWNERDRGLLSEEEYRKQFIAALPAEYEADVKRVIEESGKQLELRITPKPGPAI